MARDKSGAAPPLKEFILEHKLFSEAYSRLREGVRLGGGVTGRLGNRAFSALSYTDKIIVVAVEPLLIN